MSRYEFRLPDIGEGVAEGEIVAWLVAKGDVLEDDQPMVEVMTDKATVTIASPKRGIVLELHGEVGEVVKVHGVLIVLEVEGELPRRASNPSSSMPPAERANGHALKENVASAVGDIREDLPGMNLTSSSTQTRSLTTATYFHAKPLATPATRRLARDLGLDLRTVQPTGDGGRVTHDDVREAETGRKGATGRSPSLPQGAVPPPERLPPSDGPSSVTAAHAVGSDDERRIPLKGLRKRIFENMARSKATAAHFTFVEECDVTRLKDMRERMKPAAEARGVKLSYLPFAIKAVVAALRKNPVLNSTFDEQTQEIVFRRSYNIGLATATEGGLTVPVVRHADRLSLLGIGQEIERLAEDARHGRSKLEDLQGSNFTITSLGQKSGLFATPIIHFPEVAILGLHQIKRRPVVRDERIVIGDVMLVSLSFDHRLIDGHVGAAFAYDVIAYLEDPDQLFLEMA